MTTPASEVRYSHLLFRFRLPFRLFLDEGVYTVAAGGVQWRVSLKDAPQTAIEFTQPPIDFGARAQLRLDNHGFSGVTEVTSGFPFTAPLTQAAIMERQTSVDRITLRDALRPINRLISQYRTQSREFWFRPLGDKDVVAYSTYILLFGATALELMLTSTNVEIASGYPFLKTEEWYDDLLQRLQREERLPLFYEMWHEAQDALERDNLRLSASLLPLAAENLFRQLLLTYWPSEDATRPVKQQLGRYFGLYKTIADPSTLPLKKSEASRHLETIWRQRDLLLHGHDILLARGEVASAATAFEKLISLWEARPRGDKILVEGPFVDFGALSFPHRSPEAMLRRALNRFHGGHTKDALEAAVFALTVEAGNLDALMMAGVCEMHLGNFARAVLHFETVLAIQPDFHPAAHNLTQARIALAARGESSA